MQHPERGSILVEFSLLAGIMVMILVMCLELALVLEARLVLTTAARETARQAAVDGGWSRNTARRAAEILSLGGLEYSRAEISLSPRHAAYGRPLSLVIRYRYPVRSAFLRPFLPSELPLEIRVVSRSERLPDR